MITIDLKGQPKEFEAGVTPAEVAKSIGMGLYKSACAARVNGTLLITALSRSTTGNVGSVTYTVARDQAAEVELAELLDKDGNVLTSSAVHVPLLEERTSIRHSFTVKEGT